MYNFIAYGRRKFNDYKVDVSGVFLFRCVYRTNFESRRLCVEQKEAENGMNPHARGKFITSPPGIHQWQISYTCYWYRSLLWLFVFVVCVHVDIRCYESYRVHYYHGKYWRRERFREINLCFIYTHTKNSSARTKRRRESRSSFCRWRWRGTDSQNQIHLKQRIRVVMGRGRSTSRNHSKVWRVWRNSSFLQHKATQARRIRQYCAYNT